MIDDSVRAELLVLETALATRDPREIDGGLASLIPDDFLEHGASGGVWDADATRALVASAEPSAVELEGFAVDELAPGVLLVTYRVAGSRPSNRASIWVRRQGRWQIRFHQGTLRAG